MKSRRDIDDAKREKILSAISHDLRRADMDLTAACAKQRISVPTFYNWKKSLAVKPEEKLPLKSLLDLETENKKLTELIKSQSFKIKELFQAILIEEELLKSITDELDAFSKAKV